MCSCAGFGIGFCMQTLLIAAQNSVAQRDMAVATAMVAFLRSIGGSLGVTMFQVSVAIASTVCLFVCSSVCLLACLPPARVRRVCARVEGVLQQHTRERGSGRTCSLRRPRARQWRADAAQSQFDVAAVRKLPVFIFNPFMDRFTLGLTRGFLYVLPIIVAGIFVVPFLSGKVLRSTVDRTAGSPKATPVVNSGAESTVTPLPSSGTPTPIAV